MNNQMGGNIEKNVDNKINDININNMNELLEILKDSGLKLARIYNSNCKIDINVSITDEVARVSFQLINL